MKGAVGETSSHLPGFLLLELAPCLKPVAGCHRASPSTTLDKSRYLINNDHNSNYKKCQGHTRNFYIKLLCPRGEANSPLSAFFPSIKQALSAGRQCLLQVGDQISRVFQS